MGEQDKVVGELIRAARRRGRLSLAEVAERVGCGRSHLSQIENAKRNAGEELLGRLEGALGLSAGSLVAAAGLSRAPEVLKQRVSDLEERTGAARRLAEILRGSGVDSGGTIRGALDVAHRSGELERLVQTIAPETGKDSKAGKQDVTSGRDETSKRSEKGGGKSVKAGGAGAPIGQSADRWHGGGAVPVGRAMPRVVPLINRVAAGSLAEFTDLGYPARVADEYVRTLDVDDPDAFAARVTGDSMEPEYHEGDVVVFSPAQAAASGDDCFVRLEPDAESTFKRVFFEKDGRGREVVRLQAINPAYPARVVRREDVGGVYPAVSVVRRVGRKSEPRA